MKFGSRVRTVTIGKSDFQVNLLTMTDGINTLKGLIKIVLPVLGSTGDVVSYDVGDGINLEDLADKSGGWEGLAVTVCTQLDKLEVVGLIEHLLKDLSINKQKADLDEYFAANYGELVELLAYVMKENFQSFLAVKGLITRFLPKG